MALSKKQNIQRSRRKLLGALSVGTVAAKLPAVWSEPTVASVVLPAHAAGSPGGTCSGIELRANFSGVGGGSFGVALQAYAYGLPGDTTLSALFIHPGGTATAPVGSAPGTHVSSRGVTIDYNACPNAVLEVNFYPVGTPSMVVCADTITYTCTFTPL